jgi:hypothetical protein
MKNSVGKASLTDASSSSNHENTLRDSREKLLEIGDLIRKTGFKDAVYLFLGCTSTKL